jgi:hypothetical protein
MLRTVSSTLIKRRRARAVSNPGRLLPEIPSRRFIVGASLGVGFVSFLATELLHYWLVPDLGRYQERLLAEGLSALIVSVLVARLVSVTCQRQRLTMARMQVIDEMNHHIRNALAPISLSVDAIENQQLVSTISEGVDRIDWALREILPREVPLREEPWDSLSYLQSKNAEGRQK